VHQNIIKKYAYLQDSMNRFITQKQKSIRKHEAKNQKDFLQVTNNRRTFFYRPTNDNGCETQFGLHHHYN